MIEEAWVFLNGDFYPERQATIPVTDRGFLFGDGMFTSIRVHEGRGEFFLRHLDRLREQAHELKFTLPPIEEHWVRELIHRNQAQTGTWRLKIIVTVKQEGSHRFPGNILMTLHPYLEASWKPTHLCLYPFPLDRHLAQVKSLSYLDYLHVRDYAKQQNRDDAILRTREGILLETSCSNLFWIDDGVCWVPDFELPYLKGVCLKAIIKHLPLLVRCVRATVDQIPLTSSVYTCNALSYVRPVIAIENQTFPREKEVEELLIRALKEEG